MLYYMCISLLAIKSCVNRIKLGHFT